MADQNKSQNPVPKVIVIFPAKNEEGTIENSIATAKQSHYKPDIIVVDPYSTDKTSEVAEREAQVNKKVSCKGIGYERRIERSF